MLDTQAAYRQRMYEPITFGFLRHNGKWSLSICETLNDLRFHASGALLEPTTTMSTHTYTRTHTHTHTHTCTHTCTHEMASTNGGVGWAIFHVFCIGGGWQWPF